MSYLCLLPYLRQLGDVAPDLAPGDLESLRAFQPEREPVYEAAADVLIGADAITRQAAHLVCRVYPEMEERFGADAEDTLAADMTRLLRSVVLTMVLDDRALLQRHCLYWMRQVLDTAGFARLDPVVVAAFSVLRQLVLSRLSPDATNAIEAYLDDMVAVICRNEFAH